MKILTFLLVIIFLLITDIPDMSEGKESSTGQTNLDNSLFLSSSFIGSEHAWVVPRYGRDLLLTSNGGKQWRTISSTDVDGFGQVYFINKLDGWATALEGWVWRTTDGGINWSPICKINSHRKYGFFANQAKFIDNFHGWILEAGNYLWRTDDGGRSWQVYSTFSERHQADITGFTFIDSKIGWSACDKRTVLKTIDGGSSWRMLSIPTPQNPAVYDICFLNERVGWILVGDDIYRTLDGGESWQLLSPSQSRSSISAFIFLDENNGWAAGTNNLRVEKLKSAEIKGKVLRTNDGGKTWNNVEINTTESRFLDIYFSDLTHGWLISMDKVYRTKDGGNTWDTVLKIPSGQRR